MAAPIYFLPQLHLEALREGTRFRAALLEERRLAHVFGDVRDYQRECAISDLRGAGPGGQSGLLITRLAPDLSGLPERMGYYPNFQEWHDAGEYWIGLDREQRPTPEDLRRPNLHPGYDLPLDGGGTWIIPIIRRPDGTTELPQSIGWVKGVFTERVKREHQAIWDRTAPVIEWFLEFGGPRASDMPEASVLAVAALALNYRLSLDEVSVLGLLDTTNVIEITACMVDWPRVRRLLEAQKKTPPAMTPETSTTSPGSADSLPDIDPAAASSPSPADA